MTGARPGLSSLGPRTTRLRNEGEAAPRDRMAPAFFPAPEDSRAWLEARHAEATELRVGFYKKGAGRPVPPLMPRPGPMPA